MPENALQRLQKLHNELKSVISFYDIATSRKDECQNGSSRTPCVKASNNPEKCGVFTKSQVLPCKAKAVDGFKKNVSFIPRPIDNFHSPDSVLTKGSRPHRKPGSAPSCSNASTAFSDSVSQKLSKFENENGAKSIKLSPSEWLESTSTVSCDLSLSPSKTLEAANEVLANYQKRTHCSDTDQQTWKMNDGSLSLCSEDGDRDVTVDVKYPNSKDEFEKQNQVKRKSSESMMKSTESYTQRSNSMRARSESPRKETGIHKYVDRPKMVLSISKKVVDDKKDKPNTKIFQSRNEIPKKIPRLDKQKLECDESVKNKMQKVNRESKEKGIYLDEEYDFRELTRKQKENHRKSNTLNEECRVNIEVYSATEYPGNRRQVKREKTEGKNHRNEDYILCDGTPNFQKDVNFEDQSPSAFEVNELTRIIEKSNEKLEKMKISKNLAMDIAKQLKNKYDEIKNSQSKLVDRLQKVEKDNERLTNEVRDEKDSKARLQLKLEELKMDSKTIVLEQDRKTTEVLNENATLRFKLKDVEERYSREIAEKQREIDSIQKKRSSERKDKQAEDDIRRLTEEKCQLITKVEELSDVLCDRQLRVKMLEMKMKEVEDEVKVQKFQLKQKTERLEETNKELESIRLNSSELEEQVKMLRQNIENFDRMHQNLIDQAANYENQIKSDGERMKRLQEENEKLKCSLQNEKDSLLIKNKIIDDQQETIKQLREKSDEFKVVMKKNQSLERLINIEREEKLELQDAVERLKWRKDELKKKVKSLENDLLLAPQEVVLDLQKTQTVLRELENQVQIKQKEWELHLQSLLREKERACSVAEFATKKLMQTTSEFQKQSEAHKRLHRVLAENLVAKEMYLKGTNEKISEFQLKQILADARSRTEKLNGVSDNSYFKNHCENRTLPSLKDVMFGYKENGQFPMNF